MRTLIVEDDFTSRLFLQTILSLYGECHIAINGREAIEAYTKAGEEGRAYDLICLDIMMPEMDGQEALRKIREAEKAKGVDEGKGVKIIMVTALSDPRNVMKAHYQVCNAYLIKPIDKGKLLEHLRGFGLI